MAKCVYIVINQIYFSAIKIIFVYYKVKIRQAVFILKIKSEIYLLMWLPNISQVKVMVSLVNYALEPVTLLLLHLQATHTSIVLILNILKWLKCNLLKSYALMCVYLLYYQFSQLKRVQKCHECCNRYRCVGRNVLYNHFIYNSYFLHNWLREMTFFYPSGHTLHAFYTNKIINIECKRNTNYINSWHIKIHTVLLA